MSISHFSAFFFLLVVFTLALSRLFLPYLPHIFPVCKLFFLYLFFSFSVTILDIAVLIHNLFYRKELAYESIK